MRGLVMVLKVNDNFTVWAAFKLLPSHIVIVVQMYCSLVLDFMDAFTAYVNKNSQNYNTLYAVRFDFNFKHIFVLFFVFFRNILWITMNSF